MRNIKAQITCTLFSGMALLAPGHAGAEEIVAGWDVGVQEWIPARAAETNAAGIVATVAYSVNSGSVSNDWGPQSAGSRDATFGSFAGASTAYTNNALFQASNAKAAGVYVDYTLINTGTNDYELAAFRFDAWRSYANQGQVSVSVLAGGGITAGDLGAPALVERNELPPEANADYDDVDLPLTGLVDYTLSVGQSVTFRIEVTAASGVNIDNVAVTGTAVAPPLVRKKLLAGWDDGVKPWQNPSQDANFTEGDIVATVVYVNTTNGSGDAWGIQPAGSYDETFGTVPGAKQVATPNAVIAASNVKLIGAQAEYTISNIGTVDYPLAAFHFDAWVPYLVNGQFTAEVLPGGGITAGDLAAPILPVRGENPGATGADYSDVDLPLTGLADNILAAGESVTFRIEAINGSGSFLDNVGVTALIEFPAPVLSMTADTISFDTATDALYTLYGKMDLVVDPVWHPITNFAGTGGTIDYSYAATNAMEFFKVEGESL